MYCRTAREDSGLQLKCTEGAEQLQEACRETSFHREEPALDAAALNCGLGTLGKRKTRVSQGCLLGLRASSAPGWAGSGEGEGTCVAAATTKSLHNSAQGPAPLGLF